MISVVYAECHLCCVTFKPFMLSVIMLNVIMLSVVAPIIWTGETYNNRDQGPMLQIFLRP